MAFNPELSNWFPVHKFRFWCQKVLPLVYDDSLSYYEILCKVVNYLNKYGEDLNMLADDYKALVEFINNYFEQNLEPIIMQYVNEWLDEHPEATTTVQDGAITEAKINPSFLPYIKNCFVTLDMFGGVCDGVADDTQAFNDALAYAKDNHKRVLIRPEDEVRIKSPVFVPSYTRLTINGTVYANDGARACFETFDRVTSTPEWTGTHDIVIDGCGVVDCEGNRSVEHGATPFRIHHSKNVTIKGITIKNYVNNHAIETSSYNTVIDGVTFEGCVRTSVEGNHAEAVQLDYAGESTAEGAIPYDGTKAHETTIKNCVFKRSSAGSMYTSIGNHGTVVDGFVSLYSGLYIYDNVFDGNEDNTINILMNFENIVIRGNKFLNQAYTMTGLNDANILFAYYVRNVLIENNLFKESQGTGILVGYIDDVGAGRYTNDYMTNFIIRNNEFNKYCLRNNNNSGILIPHKCINLTAYDNVFYTDDNKSTMPLRVSEPTDTSAYMQKCRIYENTYNGKLVDYLQWSSALEVNDTWQIPARAMNSSRIMIFAYRYGTGGSVILDVSDIKGGYVAAGCCVWYNANNYYQFTVSASGLITLTGKGSGSGSPYFKVAVLD